VICPSRFAVAELHELLGISDAIAIHNGIDDAFWEDVPASVLDALGVPGSFVLHSGGATARKNLIALAGAWSLVAETHPAVGLVLCGPHDDRRTALFEQLPRVQLVGRVPRDVHIGLMSAATAVVVPSTYEGFGFPAIEAMACGTAVVAAERASLPEICGDAALLVQPTPEGLADGMMRLLADVNLRERLRLRGLEWARNFSWRRCAFEHAAVYRRALF
jgi:glycosyltransferase involved in cell wall biosynthesis